MLPNIWKQIKVLQQGWKSAALNIIPLWRSSRPAHEARPRIFIIQHYSPHFRNLKFQPDSDPVMHLGHFRPASISRVKRAKTGSRFDLTLILSSGCQSVCCPHWLFQPHSKFSSERRSVSRFRLDSSNQFLLFHPLNFTGSLALFGERAQGHHCK